MRVQIVGFLLGLSCLANAAPADKPASFPLVSAAGLTPVDVDVVPAKLRGKSGVRVTLKADVRERLLAMSPADRQVEPLVMIDGTDFSDGTIEVEIAGDVQSGQFEGARGFVGIAFRVQPDKRTYDAFYLRPTNGRADDQVRRNHSVQYISHPQWSWDRLRQEFPAKYESYVDLVPGEWTRIRIEVHGEQARLYVRGAEQPVLVVNDLKSGASGRGAIALWLDVSTIAHFRNLTVKPR
ncbi:MAG: hypothetical protein ABI821_12020 [Pseudomonadota bacterium]